MDRGYDKAMVIVVAGNLKLAVRGSQQLCSSERVAVWCLASWHMEPSGKVPEVLAERA